VNDEWLIYATSGYLKYEGAQEIAHLIMVRIIIWL
jgi:hypothetical protein